jgi:hypothetical protein
VAFVIAADVAAVPSANRARMSIRDETALRMCDLLLRI